jgi:hypothetical protein
MKVQVKCGNGFVMAEGESHADVWSQLAELEEAFGEDTCGKCNGTNLRHVVRENDGGDKFYELHCIHWKCRARLRMSVRKKGQNFYPRRKAVENDASGLSEGTYLPNNGWMKFNKETGKEE